MTEREKLIELIIASVNGCARYWAETIADHLLDNGVKIPVRCEECVNGVNDAQFIPDSLVFCRKKFACQFKNYYCSHGERKDNGTD